MNKILIKSKQTFLYKILQLFNNLKFSSFLIIILLLLGLFSFIRIDKSIYFFTSDPFIDLKIETTNKDKLEIEKKIIQPLEIFCSNNKGFIDIYSQIRDSKADVTIKLSETTNYKSQYNKLLNFIDLNNLNSSDITIELRNSWESSPEYAELLIYSNLDIFNLSQISKNLASELSNNPAFERIDTKGTVYEKVNVSLNLNKIQQLGIKPQQLVDAIEDNITNYKLGKFEIDDYVYSFELENPYNSIQDIRNQIIKIDGNIIKLGEIADVQMELNPNSKRIYFQKKGQAQLNAIKLSIYKNKDVNTNKAYSELNSIIYQYNEEYPQLKTTYTHNDFQSNHQWTLGALIFAIISILLIFLFSSHKNQNGNILLSQILGLFTYFSISFICLNYFNYIFDLKLLLYIISGQIVCLFLSNKFLHNGHANNSLRKFSFEDTSISDVYKKFNKSLTFPLIIISLFVFGLFTSISLNISSKWAESLGAIIFILCSILISLVLIWPFSNITKKINFKKLTKLSIPGTIFIIFSYINFYYLVLNPFEIQRSKIFNLFSNRIFLLNSLTFVFITIILGYLILRKKIFQKLTPQIKINNIGLIEKINIYVTKTYSKISVSYSSFVNKLIKKDEKSLIVLTFIFTVGVLIVNLVFLRFTQQNLKLRFKSNTIFVNLEAPTGWSQKNLDNKVSKAINLIQQTTETDSLIIEYGSQITLNKTIQSGNKQAYIAVQLIPSSQRKRSFEVIKNELENGLNRIEEISVEVFQPNKYNILDTNFELYIHGDDYQVLENFRKVVETTLVNHNEFIEYSTPPTNDYKQIEIKPNYIEMTKRGISLKDLEIFFNTLQKQYSLSEISGKRGNGIEISISPDTDMTLDSIENMIIPTSNGDYTLSQIAELHLIDKPEIIYKSNQRYVLPYIIKFKDRFDSKIYKSIANQINTINNRVGYTYTFQKQNQIENSDLAQLAKTVISIAIIFALTFVARYKSYKKTIINLFGMTCLLLYFLIGHLVFDISYSVGILFTELLFILFYTLVATYFIEVLQDTKDTEILKSYYNVFTKQVLVTGSTLALIIFLFPAITDINLLLFFGFSTVSFISLLLNSLYLKLSQK
ncbi:hypothetical protein GF362_00830 [Candidatus Dojkabacteria bacterium]|nr:hypothetical protein [Candidatus Dojkabacteria bacterium]